MIRQKPEAEHWDIEADFVVTGVGAAGIAIAVTAYEPGVKSADLEKTLQREHGGIQVLPGRGNSIQHLLMRPLPTLPQNVSQPIKDGIHRQRNEAYNKQTIVSDRIILPFPGAKQ